MNARELMSARVPAGLVDQALDVMDAAEFHEASGSSMFPLPVRLHAAAAALVRAGVLSDAGPSRWRVAESREVIL